MQFECVVVYVTFQTKRSCPKIEIDLILATIYKCLESCNMALLNKNMPFYTILNTLKEKYDFYRSHAKTAKIPCGIRYLGACIQFCLLPCTHLGTRIWQKLGIQIADALQIFVIYSLHLRQISLKPRSL